MERKEPRDNPITLILSGLVISIKPSYEKIDYTDFEHMITQI